MTSARRRASSSAPVASMRSQTRSADCGVVDRAGVERGELGVALAGDDEGQRDRAVEQVGAAVLARALGGARDVEDVVEQLEGEADAAPEVGERVRLAAGLERAEAAGGLEQARRLQLAAVQVALERTRRRPKRRRAA